MSVYYFCQVDEQMKLLKKKLGLEVRERDRAERVRKIIIRHKKMEGKRKVQYLFFVCFL